MRIYPSQIELLISKILKHQVKALLFFGPDRSYIKHLCNSIISAEQFLPSLLTLVKPSIDEIATAAYARNFFNQREFIQIENHSTNIDAALKNLLSSDFNNLLVFMFEDIKSNSTLRKFFEEQEYLATIACYHIDTEAVSKTVTQKLISMNKTIDQDSLAYIVSSLNGNDYQTILNELEKLHCFVGEDKHITLDVASSVINKNLEGDSNNLCVYLAQQNWQGFIEEYRKLSDQGIHDIFVIRALMRYYLNLYIVLIKISKNEGIDIAIKSLTPPIFFKNIDSFKNIARNINIRKINQVSKILLQAETAIKSNKSHFDLPGFIYVSLSEEHSSML